MSISIFNNSRVLSATEIVKETLSFIIDEKGNLAVSFATNKGKGTGAQVVPVEQFSEYIDALTELRDNGINEKVEEELSPAEMVKATALNRDGVISFRVKSGKGAKPARIPTDQFSEVVNLLESAKETILEKAEEVLERMDD
tara:strand:+ start:2029 stop:2454 length:426 start_codon:yes stop_codon:yes gene_type:complete